jgi:hypothetical protein
MTRRRVLLAILLLVVALGGLGWRYQSRVIGIGARAYLGWVARREEATGDLTRRREAVARLNKLLLMPPPPDALVPELFDLMTAMSQRVSSGQIDFAWAAYVFTSYQQDLLRDRPDGKPRRRFDEVEAALAKYVEFYHLEKRPDAKGLTVRDLTGDGGESYTVEEIDKAAREGRQLPLK